MALAAGTRLGGYEIVSLLGVGGMGEVYRARDTNLDRGVAIKILPDAFAADPDRVARFEREARTLATLNHPHIAHVYGLEIAAQPPALVMELVEGPTLADVIASGPVALDEALPIARQICDALEAAHEAGIVHRDLKPANVKLRPDGTVKVLDFGLAKAHAAGSPHGSAYDLSQSPTMTSAGGTEAGLILGTAPYMSPEQARGKPVDKRADIWAFGAVLYEMLTGRHAFEGEDLSVTLAAVIKSDPDWTALPRDTPPAVKTLLKRCLHKDSRSRLRDIGEARLTLEGADVLVSPGTAVPPAPVTIGRGHRMLPWVFGVLLSMATGIIVWMMRPERPAPVSRFEISLPNLSRSNGPNLTLSPDGRTLVYAEAGAPGQGRLMRRDLATLRAEPIPGTQGAETSPFFSPDGAWIGFVSDRNRVIRKVPAPGGTATTIYETETPLFTPAWLADGSIVFGLSTGLWRVAASGGRPEQVVNVNRDTGGPHPLPDGRGVLFHTNPADSNSDGTIEVFSSSRDRRVIGHGMNAHYVPSGHLVFARPGGSLWAAPFDLGTLTMTREPVPLQESAYRRGRVNPSELALSANGSLVYVPAAAGAVLSLVWVDRNGGAKPAFAESGSYAFPRLSSDGKRVALGDGADIWVIDLERSSRTRLSYGDRGNVNPAVAWTPDGRRVVFIQASTDSSQRRRTGFVSRRADASGPPELLIPSDGLVGVGSWSPDGTAYIYSERRASADVENFDLKVFQPGRGRPPVEFPATSFSERAPTFSPNGRWVAYVSNESGRDEVYLSPYPGPGDRQTVSSGGGSEPAWSRDGRELFYRNGDAMIAVAVNESRTLSLGQPTRLFEGTYVRGTAAANYDVSPDGSGFLMVQPPATSSTVIVVLNWVEELKRLVPKN